LQIFFASQTNRARRLWLVGRDGIGVYRLFRDAGDGIRQMNQCTIKTLSKWKRMLKSGLINQKKTMSKNESIKMLVYDNVGMIMFERIKMLVLFMLVLCWFCRSFDTIDGGGWQPGGLSVGKTQINENYRKSIAHCGG